MREQNTGLTVLPYTDPEGVPAALKDVMYDFKIARMKVVTFMVYITKISPALVQKHITVRVQAPWCWCCMM